jgi:hypothetical protein
LSNGSTSGSLAKRKNCDCNKNLPATDGSPDGFRPERPIPSAQPEGPEGLGNIGVAIDAAVRSMLILKVRGHIGSSTFAGLFGDHALSRNEISAMKHLVAILSCLGFVAGATGEERPKDLPPLLRVVVKSDRDKNQILYKEINFVNEPVRKKGAVQDGIAVIEVDVYEDRFVPVEGHFIIDIGTRQVTTLDGKGGYRTVETRFITTDGKQLALADVWKRVKPNTVIAISANGEAPAAEFLRALHPDTVVVIPDAAKK